MTRFQIAWKILTLPCSEATRLSSESLDRTVPAYDRLAVRLHTLSCRSCRRYVRQIILIREISARLREPVERPGVILSDDARERMKRAIKDD